MSKAQLEVVAALRIENEDLKEKNKALLEHVLKLEALRLAVLDAGQWHEESVLQGDVKLPPRAFWLLNTVMVPDVNDALLALEPKK